MMGAGKSSVGKRVAEMLQVPFNDLDSLIEQRERLKIADIFKLKGETYFREAEIKQLTETAKNAEGILALGGGSLQNQRIIDHLKLYGWIVFLDAPRSVLFNRLKNSQNRPLLSDTDTENLRIRIDSLLEHRMPFYSQAHITVKTNNLQLNDVADRIITKLKLYEG
jgi:shikimate kinase